MPRSSRHVPVACHSIPSLHSAASSSDGVYAYAAGGALCKVAAKKVACVGVSHRRVDATLANSCSPPLLFFFFARFLQVACTRRTRTTNSRSVYAYSVVPLGVPAHQFSWLAMPTAAVEATQSYNSHVALTPHACLLLSVRFYCFSKRRGISGNISRPPVRFRVALSPA